MGNKLYNFYHEMYKHRLSFYLNMFLVKSGIEKQIAYYFKVLKREKEEKTQGGGLEGICFFKSNMPRIKSNLKLLNDEKSKEIYKAMIKYRIHRGRALSKSIYSLKDQYFVKDIINLQDDEVFVDCGAFVGDTISRLYSEARKQKKRIKKVIAFEPEQNNFVILKRFFKRDKRVHVIKAGVSDHDGKLYVKGNSTAARLSETEGTDQAVRIRTIDGIPECREATYIKMDIEGSEWEALHGAENTIKNCCPKLAICLYHSNEDMIRLIEYVHELVPEYKLFIRQHSRGASETVLYAVL